MSGKTDEEKQSLPVGHPEAGYLAPEPGAATGTGTLPPVEQDALDAATSDWEAEAEAIAAHEDDVAKAEAGEPDDKATAPKKTTEKHSGD